MAIIPVELLQRQWQSSKTFVVRSPVRTRRLLFSPDSRKNAGRRRRSENEETLIFFKSKFSETASGKPTKKAKKSNHSSIQKLLRHARLLENEEGVRGG